MCTGIRLIAEDESVVHARTMEFGIELDSNVIVIPRGFAKTGTAPKLDKTAGSGASEGAKWHSKYASVGANAKDMPVIVDGLNEKGLAVGSFYFPTPKTGQFQPFQVANKDNTIAPWELGSWLLDHCASVDDVKNMISDVVVCEAIFEAWGFCPPLHYVVHDASGSSIVIEYIDGTRIIHDCPLGVITNSPSYDWHMTNLNNYVGFSATNRPAQTLTRGTSDVVLTAFGQGSGMHGMPGDITPPARFVRAVAFTQSVLPSLITTGKNAILQAFHILNNFDIPKGSAREAHETDEHGNPVSDFTLWTTANDLTAKKFYFRTYLNSQIRMVDLNKMNLDAKEITTIAMYDQEEMIRDMTPTTRD
jgi:choloylglycine hydrolase